MYSGAVKAFWGFNQLDGVASLLLDNYSTGDMPFCFIIWSHKAPDVGLNDVTPPTYEFPPQNNIVIAATYCLSINRASL